MPLIGASRAAPLFLVVPVFGSAMAIFFLGEQPHLFHLFGYANRIKLKSIPTCASIQDAPQTH